MNKIVDDLEYIVGIIGIGVILIILGVILIEFGIWIHAIKLC